MELPKKMKPDAHDTAAGAIPCVHEPASFPANFPRIPCAGQSGIAAPQAGLDGESQVSDKRGRGAIEASIFKGFVMKQVIACVSRRASPGWIAWLFGTFFRRRDPHRFGSPDLLSDYMLRDIGLHNMGLGDDTRGGPLYGSVRRRL